MSNAIRAANIATIGLPPSWGLFLSGTEDADTIYGSAKNDALYGNGGHDRLFGGDGRDLLDGGFGNDVLDGGAGDDTLRGGDGTDALVGGAGADILDGGVGIDTANYIQASGSVIIDLSEGLGFGAEAHGDRLVGIENVVGSLYADVIVGDSQGNWLLGLDGSDTLLGLSGHDALDGHGGADSLDGGNGRDTLNGGHGADTLDGGKGLDVLTGDVGADRFVFRPDGGADVVTDFQRGVDKIELAGFQGWDLFGLDGRLLWSRNFGDPAYHDVDRVFYDEYAGQLWARVPGGDRWEHVATLTGAPPITESDFILPV